MEKPIAHVRYVFKSYPAPDQIGWQKDYSAGDSFCQNNHRPRSSQGTNEGYRH
jgi:hypothetical protein